MVVTGFFAQWYDVHDIYRCLIKGHVPVACKKAWIGITVLVVCNLIYIQWYIDYRSYFMHKALHEHSTTCDSRTNLNYIFSGIGRHTKSCFITVLCTFIYCFVWCSNMGIVYLGVTIFKTQLFKQIVLIIRPTILWWCFAQVRIFIVVLFCCGYLWCLILWDNK